MATADVVAENISEVKSSHRWANLGRMCGAVGVVLLLSSPLTWLLTTTMGAMVWAKLLIGSGLVGIYLTTNADFFSRVAGSRSTGLMAMSAATVALTLALVAAANYVAFRNPKEWDFTREGLYTLSPQTVEMLGSLQKPVRALAFVANTEPNYGQMREVLERYSRSSKNFAYELIAPQARPDLVQRYHITEQGPRLVLLGEASADGGAPEARAKEPTEQELTYAIAQVTRQGHKTVYFVTGHGEPSHSDSEQAEGLAKFGEALVAEGFQLSELDFARAHAAGQHGKVHIDAAADTLGAALQVPSDAAAVLVVGAKRPLLAPEVQALEAYLGGGGRLLIGVDPQIDAGLSGLLATYGVEVMDDLIVDTNPLNRLLGLGAAAPMLQPAPGGHPVVDKLTGAMVMMTARSLRVSARAGGDVETRPLAQTGDTAWGETNLGPDGTAARDPQDNPAPLVTAIAAQRRLAPAGGGAEGAPNQARLIAFGDSDWLSNRYLSMQSNSDLALNALHWCVEDADRITIRPRGRAGTQLFLSGAQLGRLKFFSIDILPTLLVACGLGIVLVRRQR